jgi:hypothetical protein
METKAQEAQRYARDIADAMAKIRGWRLKAPKDVVDDIFATMARHERLYTRCFVTNMKPNVAAAIIQNAEWGV